MIVRCTYLIITCPICPLQIALLDLGVLATVCTMERYKWPATPKSTEVERWHCNLTGIYCGFHMIPMHVFDSITNPHTRMEYQRCRSSRIFNTPRRTSPLRRNFDLLFTLATETHVHSYMTSTRKLIILSPGPLILLFWYSSCSDMQYNDISFPENTGDPHGARPMGSQPAIAHALRHLRRWERMWSNQWLAKAGWLATCKDVQTTQQAYQEWYSPKIIDLQNEWHILELWTFRRLHLCDSRFEVAIPMVHIPNIPRPQRCREATVLRPWNCTWLSRWVDLELHKCRRKTILGYAYNAIFLEYTYMAHPHLQFGATQFLSDHVHMGLLNGPHEEAICCEPSQCVMERYTYMFKSKITKSSS